MDDTQQKQAADAPTPQAGAQSATEDLKKVADRAKAATTGFSFDKLFAGRLDETNYLYFAIGSLVVGYIVMMIPLVGMLVSLGLFVVGLGATARRFRDINIPGWATLVLFVPVLGLFAVIYLCWKKGDAGANPFGAAPDKHREMFKAVLNT